MPKNYAYHSGAFMAMAKMFRDSVNRLNDAKSDSARNWEMDNLRRLAKLTDDTLEELGYTEKENKSAQDH